MDQHLLLSWPWSFPHDSFAPLRYFLKCHLSNKESLPMHPIKNASSFLFIFFLPCICFDFVHSSYHPWHIIYFGYLLCCLSILLYLLNMLYITYTIIYITIKLSIIIILSYYGIISTREWFLSVHICLDLKEQLSTQIKEFESCREPLVQIPEYKDQITSINRCSHSGWEYTEMRS